MRRTMTTFMTLTAAFCFAACGSDSSTDPGNGGGGGGGGGDADPAAVAVVSGNNQSAKTLEALSQPLVVEVTDAAGDPVSGISVNWSVTDGPGSISPSSSSTDAQGRASTSFTGGTELGSSTVAASVTGVSTPAEFSIETSTLVVRMEGIAFVGPNGGDAVSVPLGATIEWQNRDGVQHTATSTDTPADGSSFDSGLIGSGGTFTFTPDATGTWTYFCEVHPGQMSGATITVTAGGGSSTGTGDDSGGGDSSDGSDY